MTPKKKNQKFNAVCAILFATFLWGMTFAFIKDAIYTLPVSMFLFWRFSIAGIIMLIIFRKDFLHVSPRTVKRSVILSTLLSSTIIFQTIGLQYTSASTASFLTGMSVILVAIFTSVIRKKLPSWNVIFAVGCSAFGLGLLTLGPRANINQGDIWELMCAVTFACHIILTGKFSREEPSLPLALFQMLGVSIIMGLFALSRGTLAFPTGTNVWVAILYCSLFASVIAFVLQIKFQKYITATQTAVVFSAEPIFASLTSIIYLHEVFTLRMLMGAMLIVTAICMAQIRFPQLRNRKLEASLK